MQEEKVVEYSKLRGRIVEKFRTCNAFSDEIGWKSTYLSAKLAGKIGFTFSDVGLFVKKLDIPVTEIWDYFFAPIIE